MTENNAAANQAATKKVILKVTTRVADLAVRAYLPPGFDAGIVGTMLALALGAFWAAARTLKPLP